MTCICNESDEDDDETMVCHVTPCRYPNGFIPLLTAQVIITLASAFSFLATFDCHFVTVDSNLASDFLDEIEPSSYNNNDNTATISNSKTRGVGFYFFEGIDGECSYGESVFELYRDFLGSDWKAPTIMATWATYLAFSTMLWVYCSSCFARSGRCTKAVFAIVMLPIFQCVPFMILNSDFCNDYACSIGRSAKFAAAATSLYAFTGVAILFSHKYHNSEAQDQFNTSKHDDSIQEVEAELPNTKGTKATV